MSENDSKDSNSLDLLGIKPIGEAINTVSKGAIEGAGAFLSRICLPAAEEFGFLLRDRVSSWRQAQAIRLILKAERNNKLRPNSEKLHAHPRLVNQIIEHGSWIDDDDIQEMWAGLLNSSCTEDGKDESNLIFINLLSQLTSVQAKILNYGCEKCEKRLSKAGWVLSRVITISLEELQKITGEDDFHRLDRELDHLRSLDLILTGFSPNSTELDLEPSPLALHLYMRSQGSLQSPEEFFGLERPVETEPGTDLIY